MGEVYLAEDTELERRVALKVLPEDLASDRDRLSRFRREAKAVARLNHPNIVTVHSVEQQDNQHFITMEHVDGKSLDEAIPRDGLSADAFFEIAVPLSAAIVAAHGGGIVHRDLKPKNVMITTDGTVKVLDFGLAKVERQAEPADGESSTAQMTAAGTVVGTAAYMSPEQAQGQVVDERSDLFSLGIVLYEMATGRRPFVGDSLMTTISSILRDQPMPIGQRRPDLPTHLGRIVARCLEKDKAERYQSAREVFDELSRLQRELSGSDAREQRSALPPTRGDSPRWGKRAVVVAALVSIGLLVVVLSMMFDREKATSSSDEVAKLAVLPFSNLRSDPETDFLGYALADQVIGALTYVEGLTVRPSSSVRQYQGGNYDLGELGDSLAVNFVLAGNYLQQADIMRLTVELIDLKTEQTVWREEIEVAHQDVFEMQDLVSERLLGRLEVSFSGDERDRMRADVSHSPLAYEYYLRSLSYLQDATANGLAIDMLRQSIELDSTFAPAWSALGHRTYLMAYWELGGEEVSLQARDLFLKALEINPELLSALASLSLLYADVGETDLALQTARRTLEINPNSPDGLFAYGYALQYAGLLEESMTAMDKTLEIDPTNPFFRGAAWVFVANGRYDDAIAAFHLGSLDLATAWEGEIAIRRGQPEEARTKLSRAIALDPEGITGLWATGLLSALDGDYERGIEAARKWENAELSDGMGWFFLAGVYCINQEIDKCISVLDTAVERGYFAYPHLIDCRFLDPARGNPGLDAVLEKARLKHEAFKAKFF